MKRAYPIDKNGVRIGNLRKFTDEQWDNMKRNRGKLLRWVLKERKRYERK